MSILLWFKWVLIKNLYVELEINLFQSKPDLLKREKPRQRRRNNLFHLKKEEDDTPVPVERNDLGQIIFVQQDFENTLIVHFKTTDIDEAADTEYKVNWKDLSKVISDKLDQIKVVYSRGDKYEGDIAVSSYKLDKA